MLDLLEVRIDSDNWDIFSQSAAPALASCERSAEVGGFRNDE